MNLRNSYHYKPMRGFSLLELLVVIAILAIVAAFATPAMQSIARGTQIERSGEIVRSQLALARQSAMARNLPVEVRLYRFKGVEDETEEYRAIQLFEVLPDAKRKPLGKVIRLPQRMIISDSATLSTLVNRLASDATGDYGLPNPVPPIPTLGTYSGVSFRFRPDGSTDLPGPGGGDPSFHLTLHADNERIENSKPVNFFTLQIDPLNGSLRSFRP